MEKNNYWVDRIANDTYKTYNSLEEKNRALMEMYQEASLNIQEELYSVTQKINGGKGITLSDMHKFNRLSGLKKNIENTIRKLTENVEKFGTVNMVNAGKSVYKNVVGQIAGTSFDIPNQRVMEEMLNRPWHGDTFSKRLWKNTQVLASNLNEILTIGLTQGKTIAEIAIQLNNRMNAGFNTSHRLIRTETMHYLNESAFKAYKDGGCEEVEVYCAKDERTCEVCGKKHGKKYSIDKRPVLPFHPNCRCTYLPVINMKKVEENNRIIKEEMEKIKKLSELSKKKSAITKITDEIINKIPYINIARYTAEECKFIQDQHKELLKYSRDNNKGKEVAFVFRNNDFEKHDEFKGEDDKLDFGGILYGKDLFVMHNHPRNSSYSDTDIIFFLSNDNVKALSIVKNNGKVEVLIKGENFDANVIKKEYNRLYSKIVKNNTSIEKDKFIKTLLTKSKSGVIWYEQ